MSSTKTQEGVKTKLADGQFAERHYVAATLANVVSLLRAAEEVEKRRSIICAA